MSSATATKSTPWEANALVWIKEGSVFYKAIVRKYADDKDVKKEDAQSGYVLLYYPAQEGVDSKGMQAWVPGDYPVSVHSSIFSINFVFFLFHIL